MPSGPTFRRVVPVALCQREGKDGVGLRHLTPTQGLVHARDLTAPSSPHTPVASPAGEQEGGRLVATRRHVQHGVLAQTPREALWAVTVRA